VRGTGARAAVVSRRILIVDDQVGVAEALQQVLSLKGHNVELALDGASALMLARSFRPEVVLCDIGLPDISGYVIARQLRADPDLKYLVLVALSGHVAPEDVTDARHAGFDHHVAKPARFEELDEILASELVLNTCPPVP